MDLETAMTTHSATDDRRLVAIAAGAIAYCDARRSVRQRATVEGLGPGDDDDDDEEPLQVRRLG